MKSETNLKPRFAIFGRIIHVVHLVNRLNELSFPVPLVICSEDKEYVRDKRLLLGYGLWADLERLESDGLCELYKLDSINSDEAMEIFRKSSCSVAFSISARNIIKKPVIEFFKGKIFNLHDSYLPNERGGALYSWKILNDINVVGNTIHYVDEGIDSGPIVIKKKVYLNTKYSLPIDFLLTEVGVCKDLLNEFLDLIETGKDLPSEKQSHDISMYFPRQFTEVNGIINWDWALDEILKFVRAFSSPYPGAYSYFKGNKLHILDAVPDDNFKDHKFHPYCNGKVLTLLSNGAIRVIGGGGSLIIGKLSLNGKVCPAAELVNVGHTFISPHSELEAARIFIPSTKLMSNNENSN